MVFPFWIRLKEYSFPENGVDKVPFVFTDLHPITNGFNVSVTSLLGNVYDAPLTVIVLDAVSNSISYGFGAYISRIFVTAPEGDVPITP